MREWDTNGDGELDREEFRQAVRRSLQLKASDEKIVELFDHLDTNGDGALEIKTELRPAIKTIHLLYRTELERASLAREELAVCSELIKTVDLGIATAHRCNELKAEMMRERVGALSNLEAEIGACGPRRPTSHQLLTNFSLTSHWLLTIFSLCDHR